MAVTVPKQFYAGDNVEIHIPDYDARTCVLTLNNSAGTLQATGVQDADEWVVTLTSTVTGALSAGEYSYHIGLTDAGERETLQVGRLEVLPDIASGTAVDFRTHAEKVLSAIEAALEGKATSDQQEITINGRSIKRYTPESLLAWRDKYKAEVIQQRRAEAIQNGGLNTGKIYTRFS